MSKKKKISKSRTIVETIKVAQSYMGKPAKTKAVKKTVKRVPKKKAPVAKKAAVMKCLL